MADNLPREFLHERDARIFSLKKSGLSNQDDGSQVTIEPDQRAVQTVLGIMDRRARLLGMNIDRVDVALAGPQSDDDVRSSLAGAAAGKELPSGSDPKDEAMQLMELMGESGVLDSKVIGELLGTVRDTIEVFSDDDEEEDTPSSSTLGEVKSEEVLDNE